MSLRPFFIMLGAAGATFGLVALATRRRGSRFPMLGNATTSCSPSGAITKICITRPDAPGPRVDSSTQVCKLLRGTSNADRESFYTISIDVQNRVLGIEEVARGSLNSVGVHPREVFKGAALMNAAAVLLAHNHPSGDPVPSAQDIQLTKEMVKAGEMIGIPVLDHVIVGEHRCESLMERRPALFPAADD